MRYADYPRRVLLGTGKRQMRPDAVTVGLRRAVPSNFVLVQRGPTVREVRGQAEDSRHSSHSRSGEPDGRSPIVSEQTPSGAMRGAGLK